MDGNLWTLRSTAILTRSPALGSTFTPNDLPKLPSRQSSGQRVLSCVWHAPGRPTAPSADRDIRRSDRCVRALPGFEQGKHAFLSRVRDADGQGSGDAFASTTRWRPFPDGTGGGRGPVGACNVLGVWCWSRRRKPLLQVLWNPNRSCTRSGRTSRTGRHAFGQASSTRSACRGDPSRR